jgi:hypothetical protein
MPVTTHVDEGIGRLVLDDPPLNILTRAVMAELRERLAALALRNDLRALIVSARGRHFSAGASVEEHLPGVVETMIPEFMETVSALHRFPAPVVVAVQGRCLGGALELALAGDLVLAGESAVLGVPEIQLGVFPPALPGRAHAHRRRPGGTHLLHRETTAPVESPMNHPEALELFPRWRGTELDEFLWECRELLEDMDFPTVARWREAGGKVVGHFQVYFPEEIVHAAGLLPFRVRGAPIEPLQSDSRFGSYLCSILKTSLELALSGRVKLDLFVTHPICDAARNLAGVWGRNFDHRCEILYLPQNATRLSRAQVPAGRVRPPPAASGGGGRTGHLRRRPAGARSGLQREPSAAPRAVRHEKREPLARLRRRGLRPHGAGRPHAPGGAQRILEAALPLLRQRRSPGRTGSAWSSRAASANSRRWT